MIEQRGARFSLIGFLRDFGPLAGIYTLALGLTRPFYMGDTSSYSIAVLSFEKGLFTSYPNQFWDFGHLLWRPTGWLVYKLIGRHSAYAMAGEQLLAISTGMIAVSAAAGLASVFLVHELVGRFVTGIGRYAVSVLFLSFYAFLNYIHTGSSYIPGLMFTLLGVWLLLRAVERNRTGLWDALLSGAAFGGSVLVWVPFVLSIPAALVLAFLWPRITNAPDAKPAAARARLVAGTAVIAGLIVCSCYAAVLAHMHLNSMGEIKAWVAGSAHGWSQSKRLARMVSGLPRSFLFMGDDTIVLKRFLLRDPYARTTLLDLFRASLWKIVAFYGFCAALCWTLLRSPRGRILAIALSVCALPLFAFAVFIFEPGSPERYLPIYPFLVLGLACSLASFPSPWAAQLVLAGFLLIATTLNQVSLSSNRVEAGASGAVERARILQDKVTAEGLVAVVTLHDDLYDFTITFLFHPLNRKIHLPVYDVIPLASEGLAHWRREFARRSLDCLNQGQRVWISKRLLADRPRPEWKWTEGDDPRISWKELLPFFSQFEFGQSIGGDDGFVEVSHSAGNRNLLMSQAQQSLGRRPSPIRLARPPRPLRSSASPAEHRRRGLRCPA